MTSRKAIIYEEAGADPAVDRIVTEHGDNRTTIVAVPEPSAAVEVAIELLNDGVELIEVCSSFGSIWHAKVIEAVGGQVPVGSILYGFESLTREEQALWQQLSRTDNRLQQSLSSIAVDLPQ